MKSLIPVLVTVSLTLTMKGYLSAPLSSDLMTVEAAKPYNQPNASLSFHNPITPKLKRCDWELVKTAVVSTEKGLNLANPHFLSDYPVGDVNWISNDGIQSSLQPASIQFLQLGIADIQRFNWEGFNTVKSAAYPTAMALQSGLLLPHQIPSQTVVAYQTEDGDYYLLKVKAVNWGSGKAVELSVYHAV